MFGKWGKREFHIRFPVGLINKRMGRRPPILAGEIILQIRPFLGFLSGGNYFLLHP